MGGSKAQRARRLRRVLELTIAGLTIPQISDQMKQENFAASERTVWNDLQSVEAQAFQEELLRNQLADITIATPALRLKYRDRLLGKYMPDKYETKSDVTVSSKEFRIILSDVGAKSWEQVKKELTEEKNNKPTA